MSAGQHVSDDQLVPQERLALLALMAVARKVTNAELKAETGVELTGSRRRRLNELKLVTSEKLGRSYVHELTDAGWARCEEGLSSPRPERGEATAGCCTVCWPPCTAPSNQVGVEGGGGSRGQGEGGAAAALASHGEHPVASKVRSGRTRQIDGELRMSACSGPTVTV
jgi:hypothetical protein